MKTEEDINRQKYNINKVLADYKEEAGEGSVTYGRAGGGKAKGTFSPIIGSKQFPHGKFVFDPRSGEDTAFHEITHYVDDYLERIGFKSEKPLLALQEKQGQSFIETLLNLGYDDRPIEHWKHDRFVEYLAEPEELLAHTISGGKFSKDLKHLLNPFNERHDKDITDLVKLTEMVNTSYDIARDIYGNEKIGAIDKK